MRRSRTAVFIVNDYILCVPYKMIDGHSVKSRKPVEALIRIGPIGNYGIEILDCPRNQGIKVGE